MSKEVVGGRQRGRARRQRSTPLWWSSTPTGSMNSSERRSPARRHALACPPRSRRLFMAGLAELDGAPWQLCFGDRLPGLANLSRENLLILNEVLRGVRTRVAIVDTPSSRIIELEHVWLS